MEININYDKLDELKMLKIYDELIEEIKLIKKNNKINNDNAVHKSLLNHEIIFFGQQQIFLDL
jgi:hypothetical protein